MNTFYKIGDLAEGRWGLGTIFDGKSFLIIGGMGGSTSDIQVKYTLHKNKPKKSERCELNDAIMTCHEVEPSFKTPPMYPVLFLLDETYYQ